MKKRALFWLSFVLVLSALTAGAYWLFKNYQRDREAAMLFRGYPSQTNLPTSASNTQTTKTYTAKELEEARRQGKMPNGQPIHNNPMDNSVQRNLQTLDEINRINQMNQRLMEQQERMRRQNKN